MLSDTISEPMHSIRALFKAWDDQPGSSAREKLIKRQTGGAIDHLVAYTAIQDGAFLKGGALAHQEVPTSLGEVWVLIEPLYKASGTFAEVHDGPSDPYVKEKLFAEIRSMVTVALSDLKAYPDIYSRDDYLVCQVVTALDYLATVTS